MRGGTSPVVMGSMTIEDIERMPITEKWRRSKEIVCKTCESEAYIHPMTDWIWGCKNCELQTRAIMMHFRLEISR